jgi:hypothetical protein
MERAKFLWGTVPNRFESELNSWHPVSAARALLLVLILAIVPNAFAQGTGSISGYVRDASGAALPGTPGLKASNRLTFFAYEWTNPRLGKVIREIRLKGTTGFRGGTDDFNNDIGPVIASNAVILAALSMVKKRG